MSPSPRPSSPLGIPKILCIQPMPGIGDMVWHVPHLRALAHARGGGTLYLLSKPSSYADVLLRGESWVKGIYWLQRPERKIKGFRGLFSALGGWRNDVITPAGAQLEQSQRHNLHVSCSHNGLLGIVRLARFLKRGRFDEVWIFHASAHYLWAAWLARIPVRIGYGHKQLGRLLTSPLQLRGASRRGLIAERVSRFADLHGLPWHTFDTPIRIREEGMRTVMQRFGHPSSDTPWVAVGIGGSEEHRRWPLPYMRELIEHLVNWGQFEIFVCGGPKERHDAEALCAGLTYAGVHPVTDLDLQATMALLKHCTFFVGNETATLNLAANQKVPAFGLFGGKPLTHSPYLHPICTMSPNAGLAALSPRHVCAQIDAFLSKNGSHACLPPC